MIQADCDVPGCEYVGPLFAAKCGRNTKRFHLCPCACHQLGPNVEAVQGQWPTAGEGYPEAESQVYTHRSGRYQVHVLPGTINVRVWREHRWLTEATRFNSVESAKAWVELMVQRNS